MNSHVSSNFLLAVIAVFVTATAVSSDHIVSPPAKIAGHNSHSSIALKKVVGAGSRITYQNKTEIVAPCLNNECFPINQTLYDGATPAPKNDSSYYNVPVVYGTLAKTAWYQITFLVLNISSCCSMVITALVYHFSESLDHSRYIEHLTMSIGSSHFIAFLSKTIRQMIVNDFRLTGLYKLSIIINSHCCWQLASNVELFNIFKCMDNISKFKKKISKHTTFHKFCWFFQIVNISTIFCCIDIFHQVDESIRSLPNPEKLSLLIDIKPTILSGTIPGLVNILVYVYLFQYNKIPISSIHPELISFYKKRTATRNLMFKLSILMFTVDTLYILDITMEWNYNAIHVLHLVKSAQGLLISYVIFFRPFAPVIYNKLLKRPRQQESANEIALEETANPLYKVTAV